MSPPNLPSTEICERARLSRDARFDGLFFTAVRSTGIYCRPVCPAPAPKPRNVSYFASAAAASQAGYRPCLRCRPELSPDVQSANHDDPVQRALALIGAGELEAMSVAGLAAAVDTSPRHLRRLFLAGTGATPMAVHATRRLLLARQLLAETSMPITEVALASGFKSLRRFNTAFRESNGMPPGSIRRLRVAPPTGGLVLRLAYRPPLAFGRMLAFLSLRALPGIERVDADSWTRITGPVDAPVRLRVTHARARPELLLELSPVDPALIPRIVVRVRRMFDLDAHLQPVQDLLNRDALLRGAVKVDPGLRMPGGFDGFETMVRAVLGQQVTIAGASTLTRRLVDAFGISRAAPSAESDVEASDRAFPPPAVLAEAPVENIGLPRARAATIRAVSAAVVAGELDFSAGQRLDDFVEKCVAIPGIGPWTAHYVAMRALGHPDAFPGGDLVLRQILGDSRAVTERQAVARAEAWRPWRSYAVMHLWNLAAQRRKESR